MSNLASIESAPISPRMLSDGRISKLEDLYEAAAQLNFTPDGFPARSRFCGRSLGQSLSQHTGRTTKPRRASMRLAG